MDNWLDRMDNWLLIVSVPRTAGSITELANPLPNHQV